MEEPEVTPPKPITLTPAEHGGFLITEANGMYGGAVMPILFAGDLKSCLTFIEIYARPPVFLVDPASLNEEDIKAWVKGHPGVITGGIDRSNASWWRSAHDALNARGAEALADLGVPAPGAPWRDVPTEGRQTSAAALDLEDVLDALRRFDIPCGVQVFRHDQVTCWIGEIDKALEPETFGFRMRIPAPVQPTIFYNCHGSNALAEAAKWLTSRIPDKIKDRP